MLTRTRITLKAARQLGYQQVKDYALYKIGLKTGYWRVRTPPEKRSSPEKIAQLPAQHISSAFCFPLQPPSYDELMNIVGHSTLEVIQAADQVLEKEYRLFGGDLCSLELIPPCQLSHWTDYETGKQGLDGVKDIKYIWEPARFGWALLLSRAYILTADEKYHDCFWNYLVEFLEANPVNMGPNWSSAQEVALRLVTLLLATNVFRRSPQWKSSQLELVKNVLISHAERVPVTMCYARAQNNNHLLTEALGLYAAALSLPDHHKASRWQKEGWRWINRALTEQIAPDGTYVQQSANYHRLMLQAALCAHSLASQQNDTFPTATIERLRAATKWLIAQMDQGTGRVPNLGHNDGAYILPLAEGGFADYRPVAQAASIAFLGQPLLPQGPWDEFSLWLGLDLNKASKLEPENIKTPAVKRIGDAYSWATLRAEHFTSRPAHADQLHVDMWWHGNNIALDAGTYSYNAPAPWDNAFARTAVHNTVTIDSQDQMKRGGRFLWLDWAQAKLDTTAQSLNYLAAEHDGYAHSGIIHRRSLHQANKDCWHVTDTLLPNERALADQHTAYLHWLLPDWEWELQDTSIKLKGNCGIVSLKIDALPQEQKDSPELCEVQVIRAGLTLQGSDSEMPTLGWISPTYGQKLPALSLRVTFKGYLPFSFCSTWQFSLTHPSFKYGKPS